MTKQNALELIGKLTKATVRHYAVVNSDVRGSARKACADETKAAKAVFVQLTNNAPVSDDEISAAIN